MITFYLNLSKDLTKILIISKLRITLQYLTKATTDLGTKKLKPTTHDVLQSFKNFYQSCIQTREQVPGFNVIKTLSTSHNITFCYSNQSLVALNL